MAFEKGKSGNPKGRPPIKATLTEILRERVKSDVPGEKRKANIAIADKLIGLALSGDVTAIKYIYDRLDGKPVDPKEISGPGGGPVKAEVDWCN